MSNRYINEETNKMIYLGRLLPESGKIHQNQEVYYTGGVSATVKATFYKNQPKILVIESKYEK